MTTDDAPIRFHYDFTDPLSYLVLLELQGVPAVAGGGAIEWMPFELRPPPTPLIFASDDAIAPRWAEAQALAASSGIDFRPPQVLPWTRKAHELVAHAAATGADAATLRLQLFECALLQSHDIGRVDVLVELARSSGMDPTGAKAVLDVDRHEEEIAATRAAAVALGVTTTPTLIRGDRRLEGFHNRTALGTFLGT